VYSGTLGGGIFVFIVLAIPFYGLAILFIQYPSYITELIFYFFMTAGTFLQ